MGVYRSQLQGDRDPPFLLARVSSLRQPELALTVRLVLDTGSRRSTLISAILNQLRLPSIGEIVLQTALAQSRVRLFNVRIEFALGSLLPIPRMIVVGAPVPRKLSGFDGVIGRDILSRWEIFISGPRKRLVVRDGASWRGWLCS